MLFDYILAMSNGLPSSPQSPAVKQTKISDGDFTRAGPSHSYHLTRYAVAEDAYSDKSDQEFDNRSKMRHLRRLQDRWACKLAEHSYCFINIETALHIQLTEVQIGEWANEIVRPAPINLVLSLKSSPHLA